MCGGTSSTPEESLRPTINENQNTTPEVNQEESIPPMTLLISIIQNLFMNYVVMLKI